MYATDRSQPPQGQALPSLKSILSSEPTSEFNGRYAPHSHHSPPLPQFQSRDSPREHPPPPMLGPSPYYSAYQTPPPPSTSHGRDGPDGPRFPPPMPSLNQATPLQRPPTPPRPDPMYPLSGSGPASNRQPVGPPPRRYEPARSPQADALHQRRISAAPTPTGTAETHSRAPPPFGGTPPRTPRVIDERYIPGEGLCYVYEDGTRVQKYIDGENVNPQWGVTKAGKPRKRLAQACTTCREKKIKCDPSSPKCIQCQKFGRECRFENAPRGHHHMSSNFTPNMARPNAYEQQHQGVSPPDYVSERNGLSTSSPVSLKRPIEEVVQPSSNVVDEYEMKRQRRGSASSSPEQFQQASKDLKGKSIVPFEPQRQQQRQQSPSHAAKVDYPDVNGLSSWSKSADWKSDPFEMDPESSNHYINLYFDHVNASTYCMFPREAFLTWCNEERNKSSDDRMLIYSVLSMGAVFSDRPERTSTLKRYMNISEHALQNTFGRFSLQLVQARLILGFVHFALGNATKAWDLCGTAIRAACGLKFNSENGVSDVNDEQELEYGFSKAAREECQRRTFWSAFIMDRFNGHCSGHPSLIHIDDCYLRLPMRKSCYEQQLSLETPFFQNSFIDPALCTNPSFSYNIGSMGHLIRVSAAWGDVTAFIYRSISLPSSTYPRLYEDQYSSTMASLSNWMSNLPGHLTWSQQNLDRSFRLGYVGTFISLHTLYHSTIIKLNRNVRFHALSHGSRVRNIRICLDHAHILLEITRLVAKEEREARGLHSQQDSITITTTTTTTSSSSSSSSSSPNSRAFTTPFTGYAILIATDALTSAGLLSDLPELIRLIDSGLEVLEELAQFWASAKAQYRHVGERLRLLASALALYGPTADHPERERTAAHAHEGAVISSEEEELQPDDDNQTIQVQHSPPPAPPKKKKKALMPNHQKKAWLIPDPVERTFPESDDLIYALDRPEFLRAAAVIADDDDDDARDQDIVVLESDEISLGPRSSDSVSNGSSSSSGCSRGRRKYYRKRVIGCDDDLI